MLDLATAFAIGGDCLADISQLRTHPEIFGAVASDPTVSRLISVLAVDADTALAAIDRARATARRHAWTAAGASAPPSTPSTKRIRWSSTSMPPKVTAHSEKEQAAPTFTRGFVFHLLCAYLLHRDEGTVSGAVDLGVTRPCRAVDRGCTPHPRSPHRIRSCSVRHVIRAKDRG